MHVKNFFVSIFLSNCNNFSVSGIFKHNPGKTNDKFKYNILNNFYPAISYRRVQKEKESDESLYTVWSLVVVREPVASARGQFRLER